MKTTKAGADQIVYLRGAIYDESGNDRNLLLPLAAFSSLRVAATDTETEEQLTISFATGKQVPRSDIKFMFNVSKATMEEIYDDSEYGWDDDDKLSELKDPSTRHLLVRTASDELVGFVSFQLTLQGEMYQSVKGKACVFVREFQVVEKYQRRGIGRHLSRLLEMIGMKNNMSYVEYLVTSENTVAQNFIATKCKGYATDSRDDLLDEIGGDCRDDESFVIYSKVVSKELKMKAKLEAKRAKENAKLAQQLALAMNAGVSIKLDATGKLVEKKVTAEIANPLVATGTPVSKKSTEEVQESPTSVVDQCL